VGEYDSDLESRLTTSPSDSHDLPAPELVTSLPPADERRSQDWDLAAGASNYLVLIGGHALGILCSLIAAWIGTRILGPSGYGHLALLLAASLLLMMTANWTAPSVVRFGVKEFVDTGRVAGTFWTRSAALGVNLLIVLATSPLWLRPLTSLVRIPLFLAPLLLVHLTAAVLWYHMQQSLVSAKLPKVNATLLTLERVIIVVVLSVLKVTGVASLRTVVATYIATSIVCALVAVVVLRRMIFPWAGIRMPLLGEMLKFSAPLLPASLVSYFASSYLDSFFIARFMTAAAVGVYAIGYQFAGAIMMAAILGGSLLQPFFISVAPEMQAQRMRLFATRVLPVIALGWSVLCVIGAAIGGHLLVLVFGARYDGVVPVLWPLMACVAIGGPVVAGYFPIAYATSRTHIVAINSIVAASTNVVLDLVLIPRYGLVGCAWATVFSYLAAISVTITLSDRAMGTRTAWTGIAALPAVGAAVVAMDHGPLVAIGAALALAALILAIRREPLLEGVSILDRVVRRRRAGTE